MSTATKILIGLGVSAGLVGIMWLVLQNADDDNPINRLFARLRPVTTPFGGAPLTNPAGSQAPGPRPTASGAVGKALNTINTGVGAATSTVRDITNAAKELKELRDSMTKLYKS